MIFSCLRWFSGLFVALSLVACGISDMQKNADKASKNSGKAAEAAQESREEIANSRILTRAGAASKGRREALEAIMKAKSFEQKATEASKYIKAFEYQMFTGQKYDTEKSYEIMKKDGLEEFFRSLTELNEGESIVGYELKPFNSLESVRSKALNVMAVAAAVHKVHHYRETVGKEPPPSFFDLIKESLTEIKKVEAGKLDPEKLTPSQVIVFKYYEETISLLQARLNMILIVVLKKVSDRLDNPAYIGEAFLNQNITPAPIHPVEFNELNVAQKNHVLGALDLARETASLLELVSEDVGLMPQLKYQYGKLNIESESKSNSDFEAMSSDEKQLTEKFQKSVRELFPL